MTTHIKSINRKVWKVVETKVEIGDLENPTAAEEVLLQNNDIALSAIHDAIDERTFEQIKNIEMAHEAWKKLEESFEGTQAVKGAKAYILKEKFASFKMKEDESVPEMFHRLQVLVNDLKALGEEVKDKDFSHKFLRCLPSRFETLVTILVRSGLDTMTPNQVLGDIMTDDTYRDDDEKEEKREKKDEKKDDKKSVAYTGAAPVPVLQERRGLPACAVREEAPHQGGARGGQSHPHRAPQRGARAAEADRPRGPGASRCVLFPYPRSIPWLLFRSSEWNAVSLLIYICLYGDLSNDVLPCCSVVWIGDWVLQS